MESELTQKNEIRKSELLFLYESTYSIPNGDPFTGEQRYDEETKKVLVSDVRIKRYIRDYLHSQGNEIYVILDRSNITAQGKEPGAAARMKTLKKNYPGIPAKEVLKKCIDVRLFGGISTEEGDAANITGPVQFALLNPSVNEAELKIHQNTSVFPSDMKNTQGSIGTTSIVPYSLNQIHGWINPYSALQTGLTNEDILLMQKALWESINNVNTRTKSNQNSLLLLQIVYKENHQKLYGLDRLIQINSADKKGEQLRSLEDFEFDFSMLFETIEKSSAIEKVFYYTDVPAILKHFTGEGNQERAKFEKLIL